MSWLRYFPCLSRRRCSKFWTSQFNLYVPTLFTNSVLHLQARAYRADFARLDRFRAIRRRHELALPDGGEAPPTPRKRSPGWFLKMHRDGSSSARSRSPSARPETPSDTRLRDPVKQYGKDALSETEPPQIPRFLQLGTADIRTKFEDITWKERMRLITMQRDPTSPYCRPAMVDFRVLDRYANIHPYNGNRVHLKVPEGKVDYINASPIRLITKKDGKENNYIAMQGPKQSTIHHTWRMVWYQLASPAVIVMLTETHEGGQEKCYQYFPKSPEDAPLIINEQDEFADGFKATLECVEKEVTGLNNSIEARKLVMKVEGQEEEKIIWHLLYTKWPDFGVPNGEDVDAFFETMKLSRAKNSDSSNPRIIHCSAGVGRSGTFVALDHLADEVEAGALEDKKFQDNDPEQDLIYETVNDLRGQRLLMVQADVQYQFLYAQVKRLWEAKYTPEKAPNKPPTVTINDGGADVFTS